MENEVKAEVNLVAPVAAHVTAAELAAGSDMLATVAPLIAAWCMRTYKRTGLVAIRLVVAPGGAVARRAACVSYAVKAGLRLLLGGEVSVERMGVVGARAWIPVQGIGEANLLTLLRRCAWPAPTAPEPDLPKPGSFKPRGSKAARR